MEFRTLEEQMEYQSKRCQKCFYNFDGICACHDDACVDSMCSEVSEDFDGLTLDSYGIEIKYIISCGGFRKVPSFLSEQ